MSACRLSHYRGAQSQSHSQPEREVNYDTTEGGAKNDMAAEDRGAVWWWKGRDAINSGSGSREWLVGLQAVL